MTRMLTIEDVQTILNIKKTKAYQLVNTPGFPSLKIDSMIRIPEDKFEEWIKHYTGKQFKTKS